MEIKIIPNRRRRHSVGARLVNDLFIILIISFIFIATPVFGSATDVLLGKHYLQTTRQECEKINLRGDVSH